MDGIRVYSGGICSPTRFILFFFTDKQQLGFDFFFNPSEKSTPGGRELAKFDVFYGVLNGHRGRHCK